MVREIEQASAIADFSGWWKLHARAGADRLALADSEMRLTWREAAETALHLSRALVAIGLRPQDVVASWLPNWVESYIIHVACERAGLAWVPVPASLREHEVDNILQRMQPRALFVAGPWGRTNFAAAARELCARLPALKYLIGVRAEAQRDFLSWNDLLDRKSDPVAVGAEPGSLILPTTGSTGTPKFAYFSAASWLLRGAAQAEIMRLSPEDVMLAMAQGIGPSIPPLFAAPVAGSAVILIGRLEAGEILELIERGRVSVVCAVPAQLQSLVHHATWRSARCRAVRLWYTTGAPMPPDLAERLESETAGKVLSGYGGMDFGGWTVPSLDDPPEIRHRTVGRPRGGTEIRLVDENRRDVAPDGAGEIWGRGPCCAQGYYRDDEGTRERWTADGWFRTGDIGRKDSGGNLVIVGRKKEVIRRGAQTIIPAELERLLVAHPKILKVAVIGLPDPRMEERVCAIVVLRPGVSFSFDEMVAFLKEKKLAPYKWPERLELASDLPLRGDKIDKQALKEAIVGRAASVEQTG
jgi:non-ribosomal peptide synthetase component E (peptide arylation enzyme)